MVLVRDVACDRVPRSQHVDSQIRETCPTSWPRLKRSDGAQPFIVLCQTNGMVAHHHRETKLRPLLLNASNEL